jgi:adenosylcobinamide kinase/adenosylcobinamide-phosphate guanylyltransferase
VGLVLITGAVKSGKSAWAETLAQRSCQSITYIATAQVRTDDPEWQQRIQAHQARRPATWHTQEVPLLLPQALEEYRHQPNQLLLIDSLGTWTANLIEESDSAWQASSAHLLQALQCHPASIILVAEETGWGVVPPYPSGRRFRDRLGLLSQQIGAIADQVFLVVAGYALPLSQIAEKLPYP